MTIDTQKLRALIRQACPLPWTLATSNSWRRIVDPYSVPVVSPCNQPDGHPDLAFPGGVEGPNAQLLIDGINALPDLLDHIDALVAEVAGARATAERWKARCLRAKQEIGTLKGDVTEHIRISNEHATEVAEARGQIEHLDRQNTGLHEQHDRDSATLRQYAAERDALRAECERLRADKIRLRADRDSWAEQASARVSDWDEMRADRDRLRGALARIAATDAADMCKPGGEWKHWREQAQAALQGESHE